MMRLQHRRVQVGHGRPGGGDDDRWSTGHLGQPESQEARRALVDPDVQAKVTGTLGGGNGIRHR